MADLSVAGRTDVTFESFGVKCAAWLYRPEGSGPHPAIVMAPGFGGIRRQRLDAFAARFAECGVAALAFDYRHFGDSDGEPRQLLSIRRQQQDYRAAIDYVRRRSDIDSSRVAVWGWSFSGGHALTMAAEDHLLCACIAQAPHVNGIASMAMIPRAVLPRLVVAGIRDILGSLIGRKPYTVPIVAPHGAVGALTAPDAETGYRAMVPAGVDWVDRVAARVALTTPMFSPGRKVHKIKCPVLICIADLDATVPPGAAQKTAERLPNAEVKHYPFGHFEICIGQAFELVVADQVAFLRRTAQTSQVHSQGPGPA